MGAALRAYMAGTTTAREFDKALCEIETKDDLLNGELHRHIQDYPSDARFVASKDLWDYSNRLLLLLASDAEEIRDQGSVTPLARRIRRSLITLTVAFVVVYAYFVIRFYSPGLDVLLAVLWALLGAVGILVRAAVGKYARRSTFPVEAIEPFPDIASLLNVRRNTPHFQRVPCSERLPKKATQSLGDRIFTPISNTVHGCHFTLTLPLCGPLILLMYALAFGVPSTTLRVRT